jgi:hypothetical protein
MKGVTEAKFRHGRQDQRTCAPGDADRASSQVRSR